MNRTKNTLRNIYSGIITKCVMMVVPFVIRTIIIKFLGAEYAGLNSLFTSVLNILTLSEMGFGSALVYMMYKPVAEKDNEKLCAILNFYKNTYRIVGMFVFLLGLAIMPALPKLIKGPVSVDVNLYVLYLIYLVNTGISYFLYAYRTSLFIAFQRVDVQSKVMLLCYVLTSAVQILVLVLFKNYYVYALFNPVYTILQNLLLGYLSKRFYPDIICQGKLSPNYKKEIYKKTFALTGHKIGGTIVGSLDSIVISSILGLAILAKYGNYYTIIAALMGFINIGMQAALPSIGNYLVSSSDESRYRLFLRLNFISIWVVGWCSVCLFTLSQKFMEVWLGNGMLLSDGNVAWFSIYFYTWQFRVLGCNYKDAAGLWNEDVLKPYVASVVNVILNIWLVHRVGLNGALISTVLCMVLIFFPWETNILFNKLFMEKKKRYYLGHIKFFAAWFGIAMVTERICALIELGDIATLMVSFMICLIVPNLIYLLLFSRNIVFKELCGIAREHIRTFFARG